MEKNDITIESELQAVALSNGYETWQDMQRAVEAQEIADEEALALELLPIYKKTLDVLPERTGAADCKLDLAGLPRIDDAARSVARMIRVLLFGYNEDELQFLLERVQDEGVIQEHDAARMEVMSILVDNGALESTENRVMRP